LGILLGLVIGKPLGVFFTCWLCVKAGICSLPKGVSWGQIAGAGLLGGIGFTMSIFITNLAFTGQVELINSSKISILLASLMAGCLGYCWLGFVTRVR
jgi:NhaA family Na+:H+ antiporter